jgi:hypothetical protein
MIATEDVQGWKIPPSRAQGLANTCEVERSIVLGANTSWERLGTSIGPTDEADVQAQGPWYAILAVREPRPTKFGFLGHAPFGICAQKLPETV